MLNISHERKGKPSGAVLKKKSAYTPWVCPTIVYTNIWTEFIQSSIFQLPAKTDTQLIKLLKLPFKHTFISSQQHKMMNISAPHTLIWYIRLQKLAQSILSQFVSNAIKKDRADTPLLHLCLICIPADCVTPDECSLITTANVGKPRSGFQAAGCQQD